MRTRIALVAAVPVAFTVIATLSPPAPGSAADNRSARVAHAAPAMPMPPHQLAAFVMPRASSQVHPTSPLDLPAALRAARVTTAPTPKPTPTALPAPVPPPPPPGPVDTVTPFERGAWERVAMCEEGGNWSAEGGRFSGGLGITRANWAAFGGLEFAPEGAMATEDQQIMVAERIQATPPDRYGCSGW